MTFFFSFFRLECPRIINVPHKDIHVAQVIHSFLNPAQMETPEGVQDVWTVGQCHTGSTCPLHNQTETLLQELHTKKLKRLKSHVDTPYTIDTLLPDMPWDILQLQQQEAKPETHLFKNITPKNKTLKTTKSSGEPKVVRFSPQKQRVVDHEDSIEVLEVVEFHAPPYSSSSSSASSSLAILCPSDDKSSFESIYEDGQVDDGSSSSTTSFESIPVETEEN
jgi:hypothetical protein